MGHPGISRDGKGHLRPGTLGIVLGGTSRDIPGYSEALHYIFVYLGQLGKSVAVLDIYGYADSDARDAYILNIESDYFETVGG